MRRFLRPVGCLLALLGLWGLLLLGAAIKETYDPFLVLFVDDVLRPRPAPLVLPLNEDLTLRLYAGTRPHVGKVASLQKGLILVRRGEELVEEGFGFGLPLVQVGDVAYLSRHASVTRTGDGTLVKSFAIDVADRPTRFLQVKYQDTPALGTVVMSYTLRGPGRIEVEADFTGLAVAWDRAYLMNEQGAINFPLYQDEAGRTRHGDEVGRWRLTDAPVHCWLTGDESLRFCVETEAGRHKFVGRERYNQYRWTGISYLAWSGVDIEIDPPVPRYRYVIRVEETP